MKNFDFKEKLGNTPVTDNLRKYIIPKNVQNREELNEYELQNIAKAQSWLLKTNEDYTGYVFWMKLHQKMYSDVWRFAGDTRNEELNNPWFKLPHEIWTEIRKLEADLKYWLEKRELSEVEILSMFHERLLTIHPFLDGNGRWSRILTEYIARKEIMLIPTWGEKYKDNSEERRRNYIESLDFARTNKSWGKISEFMFN